MLIKLTELSGDTWYLDANNVRAIKSDKKVHPSKLAGVTNTQEERETKVITYMMTPQGPQIIIVAESDIEVARMVNAAKSGKNLLVD